MEIIRICHIISPMQLYGKEKWLIAFLKHINRDRFHSCVVTLTREGEVPLASRLENEGVEVFDIRFQGKFSWKAVRRISEIIADRNIDILHSHDYKADVMALICARKTNTATISTPHGWSITKAPKLIFYQKLDKVILRYFDYVVPLSISISASLPHVKLDRRILINNFVDLSNLPDIKEYDRNIITYIGRLIPIKRVEDIITAVSLAKNEKVTLQIIGDGPMRQKLENLANELNISRRVRFLGFREDAIELLGRSSMLILSSMTEGMPRSGMEAMAMGKPLIGSDIMGIRALVKNEQNGLLFPVGNQAAIAERIDRLLDDSELYERISMCAADYIRKHHSAKAAVKKYEELYRYCLTSGRS